MHLSMLSPRGEVGHMIECSNGEGLNSSYLIVELVSFVLLWDVYPINPKRTIEIINSRHVYPLNL